VNDGLAGTLVWIGSRQHPEFSEVYRACEATVPQLAYRGSLAEALQRPAQQVGHLLISRSARTALVPEQWAALRARYPEAKWGCLLSSGCEGEMRTGDPWPDCSRFYWHQWNQAGLAWLAPQRPPLPAEGFRGCEAPVFLTVVAASLAQAEPWLDVAAGRQWAASWSRPGQTAPLRSLTHVLWDDSAAGPADRPTWQRRVARFAGGSLAPPQHAWLAGFPRLQDWQAARLGGVEWLLSKPAPADALLRFVGSTAAPRRPAALS